jgi:hypothetical protein
MSPTPLDWTLADGMTRRATEQDNYPTPWLERHYNSYAEQDSTPQWYESMGLVLGLAHRSGSEILPDTGNYWYASALRAEAPVSLTFNKQHLRLLTKVGSDFAHKREHLPDLDQMAVLAKALGLILTAQTWQPSNLTVDLTYDPSLVVRAGIGSDGGILHLSMTLGDDSDLSEDTFASFRKGGQEVWGMSGPQEQILKEVIRLGLEATQFNLVEFKSCLVR